MFGHFWQDALRPVGVVLLHGVFGGSSGVAVRHSGAVLEGGVGVGIAGLAELVLEQVNGVVEEVGVSVAYRKVQLAFELWPERGPVTLENCGEIVVIMPVGERLVLLISPVSGLMISAG